MRWRLPAVAGWYHAVLLAALPWIGWWRLSWIPAGLVLVVLVWRRAARQRDAVDPIAAAAFGVSGLAAVAAAGGWRPALGWSALALMVAGLSALRLGRSRPDAGDLVAMVGWAAAFGAAPDAMALSGGGWCGPAVLLVAATRLGRSVPRVADGRAPSAPAPPGREVRGTLSLRGLVVAGRDGLPRTVPLDLEVRAGDTLAIQCDSEVEAEAFADAVCGRRAPGAGEVAVDGVPVGLADRVVIRIGRGEAFVEGDLDSNLASLCDPPPDRRSLAAVREVCSLSEIEVALGAGDLEADGSPLGPFHRLLLQVARVLPSHYRVLVVVDPQPWVNAVRAELWRSTLVRAAVGRTTLWITADRELARRATQVFELRGGALRAVNGRSASQEE